MKISGQNILEVNEEKSSLEMHGDREKKRCNSMIRTMGEDWAWWDK